MRHPLGDAAEAVDPGPRRFFTWAYRLPSRGPLVWEISDGKGEFLSIIQNCEMVLHMSAFLTLDAVLMVQVEVLVGIPPDHRVRGVEV